MAEMDPKHTEMARSMMKGCSAAMKAGQDASESDHEGLKAIGKGIAEAMPPHIAKLKDAFPDMGDGDGDEGGDEADKEKKAKEEEEAKAKTAEADSIIAAAMSATGHKSRAGLAGALLGLKAKADQRARTAGDTQQAQVAALVEHMVKGTSGHKKQIHPQDNATFLKMSLADLKGFAAVAPVIGPPTEDIEGDYRPTDEAPTGKQESADADDIFARVAQDNKAHAQA